MAAVIESYLRILIENAVVTLHRAMVSRTRALKSGMVTSERWCRDLLFPKMFGNTWMDANVSPTCLLMIVFHILATLLCWLLSTSICILTFGLSVYSYYNITICESYSIPSFSCIYTVVVHYMLCRTEVRCKFTCIIDKAEKRHLLRY